MTTGSIRAGGRAVLAAAALALAAPAARATGPDGPWSAFVFAGRMTENHAHEILFQPGIVEWSPVGLVGIGAARRFASWRAFEFEIEGQIVKHFDQQTTWELDVPLVARWTRFPWNDRVKSSFAVGLGLSWAENLPEWEVVKEKDTEQVLTYWMIEIEAGPPRSPWSGLARIHHRSTAFGTFGERGGSNSLVFGVRRRF